MCEGLDTAPAQTEQPWPGRSSQPLWSIPLWKKSLWLSIELGLGLLEAKQGVAKVSCSPLPSWAYCRWLSLERKTGKQRFLTCSLCQGVRGGWCLGLEAPKRLEHQACLGWELSQRLFHPPGLPEESSAPQQDLFWGSIPAVPVPLPCSWCRSIPCPATSRGSHSSGSPALSLSISCPKLEGVEPVWWDHSQLPLPGRSCQHCG